MKILKIIPALLSLCIFDANAVAQKFADTAKIISGKNYVFTLNNGTHISGTVLSQDEKDIYFDAQKKGVTLISKINIAAGREIIKPLKQKQMAGSHLNELTAGTFIYGDVGGGFGNQNTFGLSMSFISKKNMVFSAGSLYSSRQAPSAPGRSGIIQTMSSFGIMGGKVFNFSLRRRVVLKGGIAVGFVQTPVDIGMSIDQAGYTSYTYTTMNDVNLGIILNPALELPFSRGFGLSFGAYANINRLSPVFGIQGSMMFGKLRNAPPRNK